VAVGSPSGADVGSVPSAVAVGSAPPVAAGSESPSAVEVGSASAAGVPLSSEPSVTMGSAVAIVRVTPSNEVTSPVAARVKVACGFWTMVTNGVCRRTAAEMRL
jgi:hypothetical protein